MNGKSAKRIVQAKICFADLGKITTRSQFGGYGLLADGTMFAVIAEGELYLRATETLEPAFRARGMVNMTYLKRGAPMTMRYYWVDEALWSDYRALQCLASQALHESRKEIKVKRRSKGRLKDLPNIDASMERLLWQVGIQNSYDLRLLGAKRTYLQLQQRHKNLGVKVLLALAGAMSGYHHAALPNVQRETLTTWFEETVAASCLEAQWSRRTCIQVVNN